MTTTRKHWDEESSIERLIEVFGDVKKEGEVMNIYLLAERVVRLQTKETASHEALTVLGA